MGRALALLLGLLLGGCAALRKDEAGPASAPPPPPPVRVEVQAPPELEALLETHLDIARLPVLAPGAPVSGRELARLVAAAPAQARALLETEGYFNAGVAVERLEGDPPVVRLRVEPGPRARVAGARIELRGELDADAARGDAQAQALQRTWRAGWALPVGAPFRNPDWASAKSAALAALRAQGYARAAWVSTEADVNADANTVDLTLVADSGPRFLVGELRVRGLRVHDESVVRNLAGFGPGAPATEERLLDFQERLQTSGLFDRASVALNVRADDPKAAPVTVRLRERDLQQATAGVGVSANVGPRASLEHEHRRVFGQAATARNLLEVARLRQAWEGELGGHPGPRFYRNVLAGTAERVESADDTVTSLRVRYGRAQHAPRRDRFYFVEVERSITRSEVDRQEAHAVSLNYHAVWRRLDDERLPRRGYAIALQGGAGEARASGAQTGPFARAYGRLTAFRPVGGRWLGEGRVELGEVFRREAVDVPESQRFRAGGDESVRGYAYRSLAPTVDGVPTGGNVLFTASAELSHPLSARTPLLHGALFVDVGDAARRWSRLEPALGYGAGLRIRSPIGPIKVDLAYGREVSRLRLHLSVGLVLSP